MVDSLFSKLIVLVLLFALGFGVPLMVWQWIKKNIED